MYLRQHTATNIQVGPYLAATDGFTEQTGIVQTASVFFFSKLGAVLALGTSTATIAGGTLGWYTLALASDDVNTAGRFRVYNHATAALPVWHEFTVLPQQVYDSVITATDLLDVSVRQWDGATVATATGTFPNVNVVAWTGNNLTTATGGEPRVNLTHNNGNAVTATGSMIVADVGQWGKNAIATATGTRPQVDLRLINGATFAGIDANVTTWTGQSIATSTGTYPNVNAALVNNSTPQTATDIAAAVWNKTASDHQTQGTFGQTIGFSGAGVDTIHSLCNANLDQTVSTVAASVMTQIVEGTTTLVQSARGWNAVILGDSTGLDTGSPIYKSLSGAQNRWSGAANLGNRTRTNLDLTAT